MGWMNRIFKQRAQDWILHRLDAAQVKGGATGEAKPIEPEQHYLMVRLLSMRVVNVRAGVKRFYGAVHSYASLPHPDGPGPAEFNVFVSPAQLRDIDAERVDRVVQVNQTLFGPVPFRGGPLELEVGLFSIRSADLAAPYLTLLESLSKMAGVSYVAQALPFAEPLKKGIDLLTGSADDTILEIGFAAEQWDPVTGVWVNVRATAAQLNVRDLTVEGDDYRLLHRGVPVTDYPYMLIEVSADTKRPAWFEIPDLRSTYGDLNAAMRKSRVEDVQDALAVFRRTALTSGDLLFEDASQLVARIEEKVAAVLQRPTGTRGFAGRPEEAEESELPPLEAIQLYD
jgi:hypothetical protein